MRTGFFHTDDLDFPVYKEDDSHTDSKRHFFVSIRFPGNLKIYDYLSDDESIDIGDHVIVPSYLGDCEVMVVDTGFKFDDALPIPLAKYRKIKGRV